MGHGDVGSLSEFEVRINVKQVRDAKERLRQLGGRVTGDMGSLWDRLTDVMIQVSEEWFASEGKGTWEPLAESTIKVKQRLAERGMLAGSAEDILIRSGDLLDSLTNPGARAIGGYRTTAGTFAPHEFSWGTDVRDERGRSYAHFHQQIDPRSGAPFPVTSRDGSLLPQRMVIEWPLGFDTQEMIEQAMEDWIEEALQESGVEEL